MLMNHKQKTIQHPMTEFDKFLRIRSEKQSIIHSDSQTITEKIQGFEELLKLTKTGSSINKIMNENGKKIHHRSFHKNEIGLGNNFTNNSSSQNNDGMSNFMEFQMINYNKFQQAESDEAQLKKLNKMVLGMTEWEDEKQSIHVDKRPYFQPKSSKLAKRVTKQNQNSKSGDIKEGIISFNQRKKMVYSSDEGKKFRKFNSILSKYSSFGNDNNADRHLRTSPSLNYPAILLKNNLFSQEQSFKDLREKIKVLQSKAMKEYGLRFETKNNCQNRQINQVNSENDPEMDEKENREQKCEKGEERDTGLVLGPLLAKEYDNHKFKRRTYDSFSEEQKMHVYNDNSIPKNLIEMIKSGGESFYMNRNLPNVEKLLKRTSLKRTSTLSMMTKSKSQKILMQRTFKYVRV